MKYSLNNLDSKVISVLLTQEAGNTISASLYKFRNKYKLISKLIYGTANDVNILNSILDKLDRRFDILMIHSSLNDMIPMYTGNPGKLLAKIISYCEHNNITLAMPTFFLGSNHQAKEYYKDGKNIFDVRKTISEMGLLSELFRITPNVRRSIHPTHSVCALGPLANKLTSNHHLVATTFGEGTPFGEMVKYRTLILGIGTKSLTQLHSAEDYLGGKYPIVLYSDTISVACIDELGNKFIYNLKIRDQKYNFDLKVVDKIFNSIVKEWKFKGIKFFVTRADSVNDAVTKAAKNGQIIYKLGSFHNHIFNKKSHD